MTMIFGCSFMPIMMRKKLAFADKNLYTMPYWFACCKDSDDDDQDDCTRNRFAIKWLCFRIDNWWKFISVNVFVNSFYLWGAFIYIILITFSCMIVTYLNSHARVINDRIEKMADSRTEEKIQIAELVQIIKHHQFIQT